jgi:hypothetical protein
LLDLVRRQPAFKQVIKPSLYEGIDYTVEGPAQRWFPLKRNKAVVMDPARSFGKLILTSAGINISAIYQSYQAEVLLVVPLKDKSEQNASDIHENGSNANSIERPLRGRI